MTADEARAHLTELQIERALAQRSGMANLAAYMADLDQETEETRQAYVAAAVTEIASLRAQLSGPQVG
jgi:polyhydroxyalkanoate synthesis regulator phasin